MGSELGTVLRHVRCVLVSRAVKEQSDAQLLSRFARDGAEEAFAALVQRHGQHVWRVCRHVLSDDHDAEDAFQATFLVLARHAGSIRKKEALASWLHGAAYRVAMRAKRDAGIRRAHERRGRTMPVEKSLSEESLREALAFLDEEVERLPSNQRAVFVLCAVEGKTIAAAAQQLAWKEGTVSGTLSRARKQLQRRLSRRGVTLSAALAAFAVTKQAGAAVPANLVHETVQAALLYAAGSPEAASAPSILLAEAMSKTMLLTKVKIATVIILAGCVLSGAGSLGRRAFAEQPMQPATPPADIPAATAVRRAPPAQASAPSPTTPLAGTVLDDRGRPVAGASVKLWTRSVTRDMTLPARTTTDSSGRFRIEMTAAERSGDPVLMISAPGRPPEWTALNSQHTRELTLRLPSDDVALTGRVLDQEGRPIAGATVQVTRVGKIKKPDTLDDWLATTAEWSKQGYYRGEDGLSTCATRFFDTPRSVTTGSDGRWRLTGFGQDRLMQATVSGPGVERRRVWLVTRPPAALRSLPQNSVEGWYAGNMELVLRPSRPIVGTVRDKASGKPLPGMHVRAPVAAEPETFTDANGHYRVEGLPKLEGYTIVAEGLPYFNVTRFLKDQPGFAPLTVDFELERGLLVHGHLRDKATGNPVTGRVLYFARADNPHINPSVSAPSFANDFVGRTDRDGFFSQVVLPGRGWLSASAADDNAYVHGLITGSERPPLRTAGGGEILVRNCNTIVPIEIPEAAVGKGDAGFAYDIDLQPALTRKGEVVAPDGQRLAGVQVAGLQDEEDPDRRLATADFKIEELGPEPRPVIFYCPQRGLGKAINVAGTSTEPLLVRLQPVAAVRGRVLDGDGRPVASLKVTLQPINRRNDLLGVCYRPAAAWRMLQQTTRTDEEGRFLVKGLIADLTYAVVVTEAEQKAPGLKPLCAVREVNAKPGESKDVGELRTEGD